MTTETKTTAWQVGRLFNFKLEDGVICELECTFWDCERRAFKATDDSGFLDMTWDDFDDQAALGRVELVAIPE
jgi:hypothetical protein